MGLGDPVAAATRYTGQQLEDLPATQGSSWYLVKSGGSEACCRHGEVDRRGRRSTPTETQGGAANLVKQGRSGAPGTTTAERILPERGRGRRNDGVVGAAHGRRGRQRRRLRPRDFRRRGTGQRAGPRRGREGEGRRKAAVLVGAGRRSKRRRGGGRVWGSHGGGGEGIGRRELLSLARCERVSGGASRGTRERGFEREGG